jgi:hypothetical protein
VHWYDGNDIPTGNEKEQRARDPEIDEAKKEVVALLQNRNKSVFFLKQLQVMLEAKFYHWIVGRGLRELIDEGIIAHESVFLKYGTATFVFNRKHRYPRRQIRRAATVINNYSEEQVSHTCGSWAENLFLVALMQYGFTFASEDLAEQRNTRRFRGKVWSTTQHQLDFLVARDGIA